MTLYPKLALFIPTPLNTADFVHLLLVADNHYNKAVRSIAKAAGPGLSTDAILASSLIFCALKILRGSFHRALQHAYSGVKIIGDKQPPSSPHSPRTTQFAEELHRSFLSLQNQVKELSEWATQRAYDTIRGFDPPIIDHFDSVEDAQHQINIFHDEVYCISQHGEYLLASGQSLEEVYSTNIAPRLTKAKDRFNQWSHGIKQMQISNQSSTEESSQSHLLLRIWELLFKATLNSISTADCFNTYDPDLVEALEIAEQFLDNENKIASDQPSFSLSSGVIPVLFR